MCGICGIFYKEPSRVASDSLIRDMTRTIRHRGPDSDGYYVQSNIALGHARLSIIDLESGSQPMFNEDGSLVIVYNGELYNYLDLRNELISRGCNFNTHCDTEVVLYAYQEFGAECLKRFRGMFAFAIYDIREKSLFLARDRLGIKPLYYYHDSNGLCFGSEIKALLASGLVQRGVNSSAFDYYINLGYVPAPMTLFEGIHKLLPGQSMFFKDNESRLDKYWSLNFRDNERSYEECEAQVESMLDQCIQSHLMSDVPLGVFLSGGLDSSSVTALMTGHAAGRVKTFCVGYRNSQNSELEYARIVADAFNTDHHEFILSPYNFFESVYTFLHHSEEPIVEGAAIALYHLARLAKPTATVLLSGEGADEIFAGYPIYRIAKYVRIAHRIFGHEWLHRLLAQRIKSIRHEKIQKYLEWMFASPASWYHTVPSDVTPSIRSAMYTDEYARGVDGNLEQFISDFFSKNPATTELSKMLSLDTTYWLPDDLLLKADKMTMAASVELRVPFLDHSLVELAATLPDRYKLHGKKRKYILKRLMEKHLPNEIIYRKKMGFPLPTSDWFRNELYVSLREFLLKPTNHIYQYCNRDYVQNLLDAHKSSKWDASRRLLSLLIFEVWHQQYILEKSSLDLDFQQQPVAPN